MTLLIVLASVPVVIWCYLLIGRGGFWLSRNQFAPQPLPDVTGQSIAIVIPARNEADVIGDAVQSLLNQSINPLPRIFVVDDGSTDGTATACGTSDRVRVIAGTPLPPGWTGKLWALSQGVDAALATTPDFLLLTDADVRHHVDSIRELAAIAASGFDLVSYMVLLSSQTAAERALIPAFVFFFLMLYPPAFIRSGRSRVAGAAGGCILIRTQALLNAGGLASISNQVIDDCALARAVKQSGGRVWLGLTPDTVSIRSYDSFSAIGNMIARTAFNQLNHSVLLLTGTVAGLAVTYLLSVALLFSGKLIPTLLAATAWLMMSLAYLPTVRLYRQNVLWSLALPAIALFYLGATFTSAVRYWRGIGGQWKGRAQDV